MNSKATETTVSLPNLLVDGSDAEFRELIALLYATSGRLQAMRRELAKALRRESEQGIYGEIWCRGLVL